MSSGPLRLGWFSTGRGEGSYGLLNAALDAIKSGDPEVARAEMFDIMSRHHEFVLSMYGEGD